MNLILTHASCGHVHLSRAHPVAWERLSRPGRHSSLGTPTAAHSPRRVGSHLVIDTHPERYCLCMDCAAADTRYPAVITWLSVRYTCGHNSVQSVPASEWSALAAKLMQDAGTPLQLTTLHQTTNLRYVHLASTNACPSCKGELKC